MRHERHHPGIRFRRRLAGRRRRAGLVHRALSVLLLLVIAAFIGASGWDHCHDHPGAHGADTPHLLCLDDCAPAMIPTAPVPPPADPMPRPVYEEYADSPVPSLEREPEKAPPRG